MPALAQLLRLATPRALLAMALAVGVLGMQSGRGTLAYFTSTATSTGNVFAAGLLDLDQEDDFSTAAITFSTADDVTTAANCENDDAVAGTFVALEDNATPATQSRPMVPGDRCAALFTLSGAATTVDMYYNLTVQASAALAGVDQRLANKLELNIAKLKTATLDAACAADADLSDTDDFEDYETDNIGTGGYGVDGTTARLVIGATTDLSGALNPVLEATESARYCIQIYLPRNGAGVDTAYGYTGPGDANTVQGGTVNFTITANGKQIPQLP